MSNYSLCVNAVAQKKDMVTGQWHMVKVASLGKLTDRATWVKHWPLRVSLFSKTKAGAASSLEEFMRLVEALQTPSSIPYKTEKEIAERPVEHNRPMVNASKLNWLKELERHAR